MYSIVLGAVIGMVILLTFLVSELYTKLRILRNEFNAEKRANTTLINNLNTEIRRVKQHVQTIEILAKRTLLKTLGTDLSSVYQGYGEARGKAEKEG